MKTNLDSLTVGKDTLKVGTIIHYGVDAGTVVAIYNLKGERIDTYGPMVDVKFPDGYVLSQVVPGLDRHYHGILVGGAS